MCSRSSLSTAFADSACSVPASDGPAGCHRGDRPRPRRARWQSGLVRTLVAAAVLVGFVSLATAARADEAFYNVAIDELELVEGRVPTASETADAAVPWRRQLQSRSMRPYAVLEGDGEVVVRNSGDPSPRWFSTAPRPQALLIKTPAPRTVEGRLFVAKTDLSGMTAVRFRIPASAAHDKHAEPFLTAKAEYFEELGSRRIPGAAWFGNQARRVRAELGKRSGAVAPAPPAIRGNGWWLGASLEDTYELFSGGRAVSENLQLDRDLRVAGEARPTVDVDSIKGITVAELDWKAQLAGKSPALDPLAFALPPDQHVVFFPSFAQFIRTRDELTAAGAPVLHAAEPRSEDLQIAELYERQLGTSLSVAARLIGPQLIRSVALTGSDPYYRTGTDVAVLFETEQPEALKQLLLAQLKLAATKHRSPETVSGELAGLQYLGMKTPDRKLSSYLTTFANGVLLTNSLVQVRRLGETLRPGAPALAGLPEYQFFRTRYALGDASESAFVFLSDAAIRRWCSPRWRIGSSRRLRDLANLSELQAQHFENLARGRAPSGALYADASMANLGELSLGPQGVLSSVYNTLEFQTPIAELAIDKVTEPEHAAYVRWRDGYQRNWRWAFDPIGLRLQADSNRLAGDLTIMPLIAGSEYNRFLSVTRGGRIPPADGDPHSALGHLVLAINTESPEVRQWASFAAMMAPNARIDVLSWLGATIAVYADADPFWDRLAQTDPDKLDEFLRQEGFAAPVAVRIAVSNPFKLATFLIAARAFIEQTAAGLTTWESLSYKDQVYVKIAPSARARAMDSAADNAAIYYAVAGDALVLTPNEALLKRAIDRGQSVPAESTPPQPAAGAAAPASVASAPPNWIGENLAAYADRGLIEVLGRSRADDYQSTMRELCWSNLPALNHWRRLFPDQDPVQVHEQYWHARLVCPGGGQYVWNDQFQTMESTVFGHPGEPKTGPPMPEALRSIRRANFGLTFEKDGLRARVELDRGPASGAKK